MSRQSVGGVTGIVGALIGGFMGYNQAVEAGLEPWQGALILGGVGLVLGGLGGLIIRSVISMLVYVVLLGVLAFFFREQIEALTGIDPVAYGTGLFESIRDFLMEQIAERRVE